MTAALSKTVTSYPQITQKLANSFWLHTWFSFVSDILKFGIEDSFLKHSQENDSTNPKLNSQEISPVAGRPCQPQNTKQDIYNAHHHEKLSSKWVRNKKED